MIDKVCLLLEGQCYTDTPSLSEALLLPTYVSEALVLWTHYLAVLQSKNLCIDWPKMRVEEQSFDHFEFFDLWKEQEGSWMIVDKE